MQDDNLLDLVNSAIATLLEVKQRLENGEGIPAQPKDPEKGWEPVEFFDNLPGRVSETMQEAPASPVQDNVPVRPAQAPAPQVYEAQQVQRAPQPAMPIDREPQVTIQQEPAPRIGGRFCRNCGAEIRSEAKFCRGCGQKIE